ncbi:acyltransferase [Zunongwangia sp. HGR-M22]|uniref:acyltransferase n=1 Tax=Zunongwangia sp. HGR-M22 TaxID=3015168 RepID=UPI0022DE69A3|nr:acyltransferase [Zunongwangia sp. HGR-M22]WBL26002.1 acyltransferase [Zunongwangia sp. HGR-M22]
MYYLYKITLKIRSIFTRKLEKLITIYLFKGNRIDYKTFRTRGIPYTMVAKNGRFSIDENFAMNNGIKGNPIGYYNRCTFFVNHHAELIIGKNVGISQTALICHHKITICDNVKIGGGVKIFDTDFHSLDPKIRASKEDVFHKAVAPVIIKENAFLGAGAMILKGVTVGENSIVGAYSLVTKDIPDNQIWGGNPAKFIKNV